MDPNYSIVQPVELGGAATPASLLKDVYALYGSQFRRWFVITAPTSLLAAVILLMADQRIRTIYRSIPPRQLQFHLSKVAETGVLRFGSFFRKLASRLFCLGSNCDRGEPPGRG